MAVLRRRPQAPKMRSVVIVMAALRNYIPSTEPHTEWQRSEKGVLYMRYQAGTHGDGWCVKMSLLGLQVDLRV